jgi:serine/threonine protein kinase/TPR repeat protein
MLCVKGKGVVDQEVFVQHGLSVGRNPSNTVCIDDPAIDRIHSQILRTDDGKMILHCLDDEPSIALPDGTLAASVELLPETTFEIGSAVFRCEQCQTRSRIVVSDNPWAVRCPYCHVDLIDQPKDQAKCSGCSADIKYFQSKNHGFEGWLPRRVGPYQVRAFVAQGGMGIVLRGLNEGNDLPAAIKLICSGGGNDRSETARFASEVQILKALRHPNVVRLQDSGTDRELPWLAMDWVDGQPLSKLIASSVSDKSPLPVDHIGNILRQMIQGLAYLHENRIVHRDLKPDNVLVANDDLVKVADFGIAKSGRLATAVTALTQTGVVAGTESYMAPEQSAGQKVTPASDVFSLGIIWFEMLTGHRPTGAYATSQIGRQDVPPEWSPLIDRCLSGNANLRPSLPEISAVLDYRGFVPQIARATVIPAAPGTSTQGVPATTTNGPGRSSSTLSRVRFVVVLLIVLFGLGFGGTLLVAKVLVPTLSELVKTINLDKNSNVAPGLYIFILVVVPAVFGVLAKVFGGIRNVGRKQSDGSPSSTPDNSRPIERIAAPVGLGSVPATDGSMGSPRPATRDRSLWQRLPNWAILLLVMSIVFAVCGGGIVFLVPHLTNMGHNESNDSAAVQSASGARVLPKPHPQVQYDDVDAPAPRDLDANTTSTPAESQAWVQKGTAYAKGDGVPQDDVEAVKWFHKAAEAGEVLSMNRLGVMYASGRGVVKDEAEAVKWFRKAAEAGNSEGMANLGNMYQNGRGLVKNETEAVKWLRKAADAGNAGGMSNLGVMYELGQGVPKDEAEAVTWYRTAAEEGDAGGMFNLGRMCSNGFGVTRNRTEAVKWYRKAAAAGLPQAKQALQELGETP